MRILVLFLISFSHILSAKDQVLIVGVLKWQDSQLSSFSDEKRKDKELAELYRKAGAEVTELYDEQATFAQVSLKLKQCLAKADDNFIFYFCGHGIRKHKKGQTIFATYDIQGEKNGLSQAFLLQQVKANFKGKKILLLADCCYSGALAEIAANLPRAAALCSVHKNSISTGNWTFTQTLLDCLNGNKLADSNGDASLSFQEIAEDIKLAMRYREGQVSQAWSKEDFPIAKTAAGTKSTFGQYVQHKGKNYRVIGKKQQQFICNKYHYNHYSQILLKKLSPVPSIKYKKGARIQAFSSGSWYPGKIIAIQDGAYLIHFDGYGNEYDEWLWPVRLKNLTKKK